MLRQINRENEEVVIKNELNEISERTCWIDLIAPSATELELVSRRFAIDFRPRTGGIVEEPTYICMRVSSVSPKEGHEPFLCQLTVILGENFGDHA
jgi:Mg2+ and Co2+ transporter CorA